MFVGIPAPGPGARPEEVRHDLLGRLEGAVAVVERNMDAITDEANDVRPTITGQVSQEEWVRDGHALGVINIPEVRHDQTWLLEGSVTVVERNMDAISVEADDVGPSITGQVCQEARVYLDMPAFFIPEVIHNPPGCLEGIPGNTEIARNEGVSLARC